MFPSVFILARVLEPFLFFLSKFIFEILACVCVCVTETCRRCNLVPGKCVGVGPQWPRLNNQSSDLLEVCGFSGGSAVQADQPARRSHSSAASPGLLLLLVCCCCSTQRSKLIGAGRNHGRTAGGFNLGTPSTECRSARFLLFVPFNKIIGQVKSSGFACPHVHPSWFQRNRNGNSSENVDVM